MSDSIKIGGKDVDLILRYKDVSRFRARFNKLFYIDKKLREKKGYGYNYDFFIFWAIYKCIKKKYFWPFRKPFRSLRKMIKEIEVDDYDSILNFFNVRILGMPAEDKELKNEPAA